MYGHTGTARLLIRHGADVNAREANGITALMMAADGGNLDLVQALLARGAQVDATTLGGESALLLAADKGYKSIVRLLQNAGATAPHDYRPSLDIT
jgi:ankyrin repeat protein